MVRIGTKVLLERTWTVGDHLNSGGFGEVHRVACDGETAVAKFVPQEPGADRELLFGDVVTGQHLMPVIDQGAYRAYLVLVMPEAEYSLAEHLEAHGALTPTGAVAVVSDLVAAMNEYSARGIVHRDLSTGNLLYLGDRWVVTDFGIARYADATTAPETRKMHMNAVYAAPERWRNETATLASDVYSLGAIAYELLEGHPPFDGQTFEELSRQHQFDDVPPMGEDIPTLLSALVHQCLIKSAPVRPLLAAIATRVERLSRGDDDTPTLPALQKANSAEIVRQAERTRAASEAETAERRRHELTDAAFQLHKGIVTVLTQAITSNAPAADISDDHNGTSVIRLGDGQLRIHRVTPMSHSWGLGGPSHIDVVAYGSLAVTGSNNPYGYDGRAHSLWFCNATAEETYEWFETAFMDSAALATRGRNQDPYALPPGDEAAQAIAPVMGTIQIAWRFTPVRIDDMGELIERWSTWLALASDGRLQRPTSMPEHTTEGSWRRR